MLLASWLHSETERSSESVRSIWPRARRTQRAPWRVQGVLEGRRAHCSRGLSNPHLLPRRYPLQHLTFSRGATRCEVALPAYGATRRPFHQNEAGSQEWNTFTLMGQHTVPLIEDHAATRGRWSLNSLTDSAEERISHDNMPGFEIMFKAEGKHVEAKLQAHVLKKKICLLYTSPSPRDRG